MSMLGLFTKTETPAVANPPYVSPPTEAPAVETPVETPSLVDQMPATEAEPQRVVRYKRVWKRTGMFGRGKWVNVPYYTYSSGEACDTSSGT